MFHRGAEHHGLTVAGFGLPVADHRLVDRHGVHHPRHLGHVEVIARAANLGQILLDADIDDEGPGRHQMAGGNQFTDTDLIGHVGEDRPQTLAVAPIGRRRDAVDPAHGVAMKGLVDDPAVAVGRRVMGFIDDQQVDRRHGLQVGLAGQGLNHGEGDLAVPGLCPGIHH